MKSTTREETLSVIKIRGAYTVRYSRGRGIYPAEIPPLLTADLYSSGPSPPFDTFLTFAKKRAGETDEQIPFDCLDACFAVIVPRFAAHAEMYRNCRVE